MIFPSRRLARMTLPLVVTAVAAAGCGGSGKHSPSAVGGPATTTRAPLSPTAYHLRVNAAIAPWDIAVHGLSAQITTSSLRQVVGTARQAERAVSALRPPSSVAGLQSQLVATLNSNALHAEQWARALQGHRTGAAARFAAEFRQDGRNILRIDNDYKAKGVTL